MENRIYYILLALAIIGVFVAFGVQFYLGFKTIKHENEDFMFPPWPSKCPDYWEVTSDGQCSNVHRIGQCKTNDNDLHMDFKDELFNGDQGAYNKCEWAKTCNAPWEGIDALC